MADLEDTASRPPPGGRLENVVVAVGAPPNAIAGGTGSTNLQVTTFRVHAAQQAAREMGSAVKSGPRKPSAVVCQFRRYRRDYNEANWGMLPDGRRAKAIRKAGILLISIGCRLRDVPKKTAELMQSIDRDFATFGIKDEPDTLLDFLTSDVAKTYVELYHQHNDDVLLGLVWVFLWSGLDPDPASEARALPSETRPQALKTGESASENRMLSGVTAASNEQDKTSPGARESSNTSTQPVTRSTATAGCAALTNFHLPLGDQHSNELDAEALKDLCNGNLYPEAMEVEDDQIVEGRTTTARHRPSRLRRVFLRVYAVCRQIIESIFH